MKDFIPYEEALALKELGFAEETIYIYFDKDDIKMQCGMNNYPNQIYPTRILAPTYSQAFRWFREKYFIYHRIDRDYDDWTYELCEFKSGNKHIPTGFKKFNSYEEAELACLRKLIEIVKNK